MRRHLSRITPGLAVTALLCLAAAAPQRPQMPEPPPCVTFSQSGGGDSVIQIGFGGAVRQPLPPGLSIAACSLSVRGMGISNAYIVVREWDPLLLAPDPQTVMLRYYYFTSYNLFGAGPWLQFFPPLITRSLRGVAEPPRPTTAVEVRNAPVFLGALGARYAPEGNPSMPAALTVPGGPVGVLEGSHPVLAHGLCSGDEDTQLLCVAQSVRHTDTALLDRPAELVQTFNVPEEVELRWVELVVDSAKLEPPVTPETIIAIVDPQGAPVPETFMPPSLVEAPFPYAGLFPPYTDSGLPADPRWAANLDFDHTVTLYPGQDYWLFVRAAHAFTFAGRSLTGSEPPEFTAGIGTLFTRNSTVASWHPAAGRVLSFKLIGRPASTTSVPGTRVAFALTVTPNPARGIALVTWSGAVGPVRFEVFDARGRRVAAGSGGAAGTWSWGAAGARPLAAGVYFVQARDSQDRRVVRRFVLVK